MSDLAVYQAPTYRTGQLVEIKIGDAWTIARIESGEQSLSDASWSYMLRLKTIYCEHDAHQDGKSLGYISVGGRYSEITLAMIRPRALGVTYDD